MKFRYGRLNTESDRGEERQSTESDQGEERCEKKAKQNFFSREERGLKKIVCNGLRHFCFPGTPTGLQTIKELEQNQPIKDKNQYVSTVLESNIRNKHINPKKADGESVKAIESESKDV